MHLLQLANISITSLGWRAGTVMGIVLLYEGTSRAASGKGKREAIWMIVGGVVTCLALGTIVLFLGSVVQKVSSALGDSSVSVSPLPHNWGANLTPEEREKNSRALASLAFTSSGHIIEYVDRAGTWSSYSPSETEIRSRDEAAAVRARLELNQTLLIRAAFDVYIAGIVSAFFGSWTGYRRRTRPPSTPPQPTAEMRSGGAVSQKADQA